MPIFQKLCEEGFHAKTIVAKYLPPNSLDHNPLDCHV